MTACFPSAAIRHSIEVAGMSEAADTLEREYKDSLRHYFEPRRSLIFEIEDVALQSQSEEFPVDENTVILARLFVESLPRSTPAPEISADPDGDISFDWFGPNNKVFSLSLNGAGRLAFAGRFGAGAKDRGTEPMFDCVPPEILRKIWRATH